MGKKNERTKARFVEPTRKLQNPCKKDLRSGNGMSKDSLVRFRTSSKSPLPIGKNEQ
ncbi:hypothetical protein KFK09_002479 [Dendrobium nobile]|uniref:Uncharacterized protein n=1 Tax=Dendrobium nobile TaxID=94219 RepID=A0A8T3C773_DENNO|nr:hypothetical protein KFK09_002479 [Dendrobium nobile]